MLAEFSFSMFNFLDIFLERVWHLVPIRILILRILDFREFAT